MKENILNINYEKTDKIWKLEVHFIYFLYTCIFIPLICVFLIFPIIRMFIFTTMLPIYISTCVIWSLQFTTFPEIFFYVATATTLYQVHLMLKVCSDSHKTKFSTGSTLHIIYLHVEMHKDLYMQVMRI